MFIFQFYSYICGAVRGARPTEQAREGVAEMIPSEPDMYNDSAGKRARWQPTTIQPLSKSYFEMKWWRKKPENELTRSCREATTRNY